MAKLDKQTYIPLSYLKHFTNKLITKKHHHLMKWIDENIYNTEDVIKKLDDVANAKYKIKIIEGDIPTYKTPNTFYMCTVRNLKELVDGHYLYLYTKTNTLYYLGIISNKKHDYYAGENINIDYDSRVITKVDTEYHAGDGIAIDYDNDKISAIIPSSKNTGRCIYKYDGELYHSYFFDDDLPLNKYTIKIDSCGHIVEAAVSSSTTERYQHNVKLTSGNIVLRLSWISNDSTQINYRSILCDTLISKFNSIDNTIVCNGVDITNSKIYSRAYFDSLNIYLCETLLTDSASKSNFITISSATVADIVKKL